jgi:hypothetical protein
MNQIKQEIRRKTLLSCRPWAKPQGRRSPRPHNPSRYHHWDVNSTRGYCSTAGTVAQNPNSPTNQPQILAIHFPSHRNS